MSTIIIEIFYDVVQETYSVHPEGTDEFDEIYDIPDLEEARDEAQFMVDILEENELKVIIKEKL